MLTYKRKLILTRLQQERLERWIGTCRFIYNMSLDIKIAAYRNKQINIHKYDLMRQLTQIRDIPWIEDVPRLSLELVIVKLDNAYKGFFNGGGFPKFANKRKYKSIEFRQCLHIEGEKIRIPKIGWVKSFKSQPISGNIKRVIIKKELTGYFACIVTDAKKSIQCQDENQVLGIDMGLTHFIVDSNGRFISNPQHFKRYEKQLRIENRSLARKKKGGKNWMKQAKKLSLLHHKIANIRRDFLQKTSTSIAKENHSVFIENLNVGGMAKNGKLAKRIFDSGWSAFRIMLEYKTTVIPVAAAYSSQECSQCGHIDCDNRKSQSEFECKACGHKANADYNAALNISGRGTAYVRKRDAVA